MNKSTLGKLLEQASMESDAGGLAKLWGQAKDMPALQARAVYAALAKNPCCPGEIAKTLATSKHDCVRMALAQNSRVDEAIITRLAADKSLDVRLAALKNRNISFVFLMQFVKARLSDSNCIEELSAIAQNKACFLPWMLVDVLLRCPFVIVRYDLAKRNLLEDAVLTQLAKDENWCVRFAVMPQLNKAGLAQIAENDPQFETLGNLFGT